MQIKFFDPIVKVVTSELTPVCWCRIVILTSLLIVLGAAALAFIVDPHYRYRMPVFYDTVYYELYATAPRLLRDRTYDTLFIGSSMTRNIYLSDIDRALGGKSMKLAASGATVTDLKKLFDVAREAKGESLKRVIFSLDIYSINKTGSLCDEFSYLYRKDFKEEYRYLFSRQTFSSMYYLLKSKYRPRKKRLHQHDPDKMFSTQSPGMKFGLDQVMEDAVGNAAIHHTQTPANPAVFNENLKKQLLPIVAENPQISFTFYLAPYHIYTYCQSEQFKEADGLIRQRTQAVKELLKYPNVKLYDYQADRELVCNDDFYSDVQHFSSDAARLLLKKLASGERRIRTAAEAEANEKELRDLIREKMPVYYKHLKEFKERRK